MTNYRALDVGVKAIVAKLRAKALAVAKTSVDIQVAVLNEVVSEWKTRLVFRTKVVARTGLTRFQIIAEGSELALSVFRFVDAGTKPHIIRPKSPNKALVFFSPYSARTAPIANPSAGTGKSGNKKNVRRWVNHPGNEAREFIKYSELQALDDFKRRLEELIKRG